MANNTISDLELNDDGSVLGALIVAGAAASAFVLGFCVKKFFGNGQLEKEINDAKDAIAELKAMITQGTPGNTMKATKVDKASVTATPAKADVVPVKA